MRSFLTKTSKVLAKEKLCILIVLLAAVLRFYQLGQNPPSLNWDEVSNGYNAYSILKTAKDEYGNFLPLSFKAFGDYNLALSVYALVPSIATFGLDAFAVRFPSAFLGTLTVLLTYFLTKKLFEDSPHKLVIALTASALLAVSPWHLQFSRYDHEANFMVFLAVLGLTLFLHSKNRYWWLVCSAGAFGLAANTYHGAKIWIPIFLFCIFFWYRQEILKFGAKLFLPIFILVIFALPIIANLGNSLIRGQSVGILGKDRPFNAFLSGYLSHYSPNFLFVAGDTIGRHAVTGMGELYVFELPLILVGLVMLIKWKNRVARFLLSWLILAALPAALATPTPHALRSITFLPLWSIIAAFGVKTILAAKFNKIAKAGILVILFLVALYNVVTYFHLYYKHYPKEKALDWQDGYAKMVTFVERVKADYSSIAITNYYGRPYIFVLFYAKFDPALYQLQSEDKNKFDKFEFFGESWAKTKPGKALVVTPPWQAHPGKILRGIYAENGDLVFNISETEE